MFKTYIKQMLIRQESKVAQGFRKTGFTLNTNTFKI